MSGNFVITLLEYLNTLSPERRGEEKRGEERRGEERRGGDVYRFCCMLKKHFTIWRSVTGAALTLTLADECLGV